MEKRRESDALPSQNHLAEATGVGPPLIRLPDGVVVVTVPLPRTLTGTSGRSSSQRGRPRWLSPEERERVRTLSATRSLRDLAPEFGVSHETVRSVLRTAEGLAPDRRVLARVVVRYTPAAGPED